MHRNQIEDDSCMCKHHLSQRNLSCISLGKVAENIMVCLPPSSLSAICRRKLLIERFRILSWASTNSSLKPPRSKTPGAKKVTSGPLDIPPWHPKAFWNNSGPAWNSLCSPTQAPSQAFRDLQIIDSDSMNSMMLYWLSQFAPDNRWLSRRAIYSFPSGFMSRSNSFAPRLPRKANKQAGPLSKWQRHFWCTIKVKTFGRWNKTNPKATKT